MLNKQEKIYDRVCHPNEANLDAQQTLRASELLLEQTNRLANVQFTFDCNDLIKDIIKTFKINNDNENNNNNNHDDDDDDNNMDIITDLDWDKLGEFVCPYFLTMPPVRFMNGQIQRDPQQILIEEQKEEEKRANKIKSGIERKNRVKKFDENEKEINPEKNK